MKYKVIYAIGPHTLEKLVNDHLAMGWRPLGGLACMVAEGRDTGRAGWQEPETWAQAMVADD